MVMCSDGLSNMVTDEEIFELICREDGEDKAKRLIDKAIQMAAETISQSLSLNHLQTR